MFCVQCICCVAISLLNFFVIFNSIRSNAQTIIIYYILLKRRFFHQTKKKIKRNGNWNWMNKKTHRPSHQHQLDNGHLHNFVYSVFEGRLLNKYVLASKPLHRSLIIIVITWFECSLLIYIHWFDLINQETGDKEEKTLRKKIQINFMYPSDKCLIIH